MYGQIEGGAVVDGSEVVDAALAAWLDHAERSRGWLPDIGASHRHGGCRSCRELSNPLKRKPTFSHMLIDPKSYIGKVVATCSISFSACATETHQVVTRRA